MAINRSELVDQVAGKAGAAKTDVNKILDGLFDVFTESLTNGEKITIPGWLAVERTDRAARTGRNPQTGETIEIAAGHSVKLTAGSKLKAAVSSK
ncbi:HU family DNA-binding protein [Paenarthrobacter sp. YJN-5]|uniref:HU family DNA-binding protein n=1 Tax=Paenarthrobacter sp. YJN-5 TaxID=2735316 RepID=UPI00187782F6|nr:HU family DNA-binding protein [Paenarthrobacter sp. YJN-5]QOT19266.1 integration host factor [Paenarthrobacter sp. YJN-5]